MGLAVRALASFRAAVGLSARPETLAAFEAWLGGPDEDPHVAHDMATYPGSSTCGLGDRAALRDAGFVDRRIVGSYRPRIGLVISDLEQIGRERGALIDPTLEPDALPEEGDLLGVAINDPKHGHVCMVASAPQRHPDGTITFESFDAGQIDRLKRQAVARKLRRWRFDPSRGMRGVWLDSSTTLEPRYGDPNDVRNIVDGIGERVVSWWVSLRRLEASATPTPPELPGSSLAPAGSSPGASAPSPATSGASERPTLRRGSRGPAVGRLQALLGIKVDDDFGPGTEAAVKRAQKAAGLKDDGVVGPLSWQKFSASPAAAAAPPAPSDEKPLIIRPGRERVAIDVSAVQFGAGRPDWARVGRVAGIGWARATIGKRTPDTTAGDGIRGMLGADMLAGVYGVVYPRHGRPQDADEQAAELANAHKALGATARPMVDFEPVADGGATPAERLAALVLFVRTLIGFRLPPLVYVGWADMINLLDPKHGGVGPRFDGVDELARLPLMLAAYMRTMPPAPAPWKSVAVWQKLGSAPGFVGAIDGIKGAVDVSDVLVPLEELRAAA